MIIETKQAPAAIGPYSQARKEKGFLFVSGQLGIDVEKGGLADNVEAQAHNSMKNIGAILKESGADYANIVKTTIFLKDLNDFAAVNQVYQSFFANDLYPARSCIEVSKLPLGGLVEIEAIAVL